VRVCARARANVCACLRNSYRPVVTEGKHGEGEEEVEEGVRCREHQGDVVGIAGGLGERERESEQGAGKGGGVDGGGRDTMKGVGQQKLGGVGRDWRG
jgi:hypothetical protein